MKRLIPLLLVLIVVVSGCLFKPPAEVNFSIDKTTVLPSGNIHLIVIVNNTGKVGLTGATLLLGSDNFQVIQEPKFPDVLPVGKSIQLMWILKAPSKPGYYNLKVSLELTDELKRTWTGFYGRFRITVSEQTSPQDTVSLNIEFPQIQEGGKTYQLVVKVNNSLDGPIKIIEVQPELLEGMRIVERGDIPPIVGGGKTTAIKYLVKAPYAKRKGFVSVLVEYRIGREEKSIVKSLNTLVVWKPWNASKSELEDAYGPEYYWVAKRYLVDSYWLKRYNSTATIDREKLRNLTIPIVNTSESEAEAARSIVNWMFRTYSLDGSTSTLDPLKILNKSKISYSEGQILFTSMMRSLGIPSMIITMYKDDDCTKNPITGFYTTDGWYIVDIKHGFIGSLQDYLASPYFPRIYQMITREGYSLVAQNPTLLEGHEHMNVTDEFISNLESVLTTKITQRLNPELRAKFMITLEGLEREERLYFLFVLSSAPTTEELNKAMEKYSPSKMRENIKTMYEFYKNMTWRDDFTRYWKIFAGDVG